jgi:chromosome partitioning protein
MNVLVVAASKGGVGKTTVAAALAVEARRRGKRAVLVDVDPVRSLTLWHGERKQDGPALVKGDRYIDRTLERLKREKWDLAIIDTPPGIVSIIEPVIAGADLVLVPVRASPLDVNSIDAITDMAGVHDKPFVFVLNATTPRSKLAEGARRALQKAGEVLAVELPDRLIHPSAMVTGLTAAELEPTGRAAGEVAALFKEIEKRLAKSKNKSPDTAGRRRA